MASALPFRILRELREYTPGRKNFPMSGKKCAIFSNAWKNLTPTFSQRERGMKKRHLPLGEDSGEGDCGETAMKKRNSCKTNSCECAGRPYSSAITDPVERAASRAMLHAVGFSRDDFKKAQVGIASTWSMVTPCNMHIDQLARDAAAGVDKAGGKGVIFGTITISDGISMGTEGMKYSLVSREVIADSIETGAGCEQFD
jgi:hypothetical protein